jgi:hypothetical protein
LRGNRKTYFRGEGLCIYAISTLQVFIMGSTPKAPKQTSAQKAFEIEQQKALDEEVQSENRRRKALSRGQLGSVTLLKGAAANQPDAALQEPGTPVGAMSPAVSAAAIPKQTGGTPAPGVNTGGGIRKASNMAKKKRKLTK